MQAFICLLLPYVVKLPMFSQCGYYSPSPLCVVSMFSVSRWRLIGESRNSERVKKQRIDHTLYGAHKEQKSYKGQRVPRHRHKICTCNWRNHMLPVASDFGNWSVGTVIIGYRFILCRTSVVDKLTVCFILYMYLLNSNGPYPTHCYWCYKL